MSANEPVEWVRAFEVPCGIQAEGDWIGAPRTALVRWRSNAEDKLHQVYVNGRFAGVSLDCQQREMCVPIPSSPGPVRIEVVAVGETEADKDLSAELNLPPDQTGRVKITMLRSQVLPFDSTVRVYSNGGGGEVDYDHLANGFAIPVWPSWQDKAGLGLSRFGLGDFGWDGAAAAGFGKGGFGKGWFGFDADTFEFVSGPLEAGAYKFGIKVVDAAGNESSGSESGEVVVTPLPAPAESLAISSYDKQTNQLVLDVS